MKHNSILPGILLLFGASLLFSCKKDISSDLRDEKAVAAVQSASSNCKPIFFGVDIELPNGNKLWRNLMQRWYDGNGKLSNIKAHIGTDFSIYPGGMLDLAWGVVTYEGNQVYVRDAMTNKLVLRITMDDQHRAAASYFYADNGPNNPGIIDTSYYYYSGDRLTSIFSIQEYTPNNTDPVGRMYTMIYDAHGNISRIQTGTERGSYMMHFKYDYSKTHNGMMGSYQLSVAHKMMEYMGMLEFPMMHQLMEVWTGSYEPGSSYPYETYPVWIWYYDKYKYTENDKVYSYFDKTPYNNYTKNTFYTGWECEAADAAPTSRQRAGFNTLQDFQLIYPKPE